MRIGEKIKERLDAEDISVTEFAKRLSCSRTNVYKLYGKDTIDCGLLLRISRILHHDFFKYYSEMLSSETEDDTRHIKYV